MKLFGKRIVQDQNHNSRGPWFALPAIYSSLHTNAKSIRERRLTVQRFVAGLAEAVYSVEANPEKTKASVAKALKVKDEDVLQ